jgi:prepilin-type N-terminal cleavage/methylation domain-containing protein
MNKISKNQKGFSAVEIVVVILIIGIAGSIGWYVVKHNNKSTTSNSNSSQCSPIGQSTWRTYTNTTEHYCVKMPNDWHFVSSKAMTLPNGQPDTDYQGKPIMSPNMIMPINANKNSTNGIVEVIIDTSALSPQQYFVSNGAGRTGYTPGEGTNTTINGYTAFIVNTNDETSARIVTLTHNKQVVEFFYYTNSSVNDNATTSGQIINTIKFTN